MTPLPEITEPVDLCGPDGRLNRGAVGWTRHPMHRTNLRGRGRTKRWEYWAVMSPDAVLAVTVSDLDYACLHAVYVPGLRRVARRRGRPSCRWRVPGCRTGAAVPSGSGRRTWPIDIDHDAEGARLSVTAPGLTADVRVQRPAGHESLGVVVPWSDRRFQHTVKENTLPATGTVRADGRVQTFGDDAWATLDHGRGRWPYRIRWNWGSGSGRADGHVVGIQVGGKWTDGTGSTENAVCVDGRISHIGEDLVWDYDPKDWLAPWRVTAPLTGRVDLTFTPSHVRTDRTSLVVLANDTHQAFGTWSGTMVDDDGRTICCDGIRGWAEDVANRW